MPRNCPIAGTFQGVYISNCHEIHFHGKGFYDNGFTHPGLVAAVIFVALAFMDTTSTTPVLGGGLLCRAEVANVHAQERTLDISNLCMQKFTPDNYPCSVCFSF